MNIEIAIANVRKALTATQEGNPQANLSLIEAAVRDLEGLAPDNRRVGSIIENPPSDAEEPHQSVPEDPSSEVQ